MWVPDPRRRSHDSGRRTFIKVGAALAGGALFGRARRRPTTPFRRKDAPWTQIARPRHRRPAVRTALAIRQGRHPPQRALAHRQQGILGQLFAAAGPERHHHANGLFFERYHAGRAEVDPAQHRLMIHGLVERPAAAHHARTSSAFRPSRASISSNARPTAAWNGARRSSTRCSSPTAWSAAPSGPA